MTYWLCRDYSKSLETLLLDPSRADCKDGEPNYNEMASMGHPDIFNFYIYLRSHSYVRRCHLSQHASMQTAKHKHLPRKKESAQSADTSAKDNSIFTAIERELLYRTAYTHLNSGMPSLALEVLLLLPKTWHLNDTALTAVQGHEQTDQNNTAQHFENEDMIVSGTLSGGLGFEESRKMNGASEADAVDRNKPVSSKSEAVDWSKPVSSKSDEYDWSKPVSSKAEDFDCSKPVSSKAEDFDWSKPVSSKAEDFDWSKPVSSKAEDFDWSKPVSSKAEDFDWSKPISSKAEDFDWSKPVSSKAEDFDWSKPVSSKADEFDWSKAAPAMSEDIYSIQNNISDTDESDSTTRKTDLAEEQKDITSLQLKYITVFKCLIEELRSLPSTCTLEGVKLRPTVAHLLERELEVLHKLCDYGNEADDETFGENEALHDPIPRKDSDRKFSNSSLIHLILLKRGNCFFASQVLYCYKGSRVQYTLKNSFARCRFNWFS